ncbi:hypothetical protein MMC27_003060 [Xylographa pallens]|nr:hypothetical protein [Xylographa pallens]
MASRQQSAGGRPLLDQLSVVETASHEPLDERTRKEALAVAKSIVSALEKPEEVVMRYTNEIMAHRVSLRMGVELGLFRMLVQRDGTPVSAEGLAEQAGAELLLVVRIMRVICAIGFAKEAGVKSYVATRLTKAITSPAMEGAMMICHDYSSTWQLPQYFKAHGYTCPTDSSDCPFQWVFKTKRTYFETIHESPDAMKAFNDFMKEIRSTRKFWADWFPVEKEIISGFGGGAEDILLVDVGGGNGHDLESFLALFPQAKGHLLLQDLPGTISNLKEKEGVRYMAHDFFTPQPIKGARAYYTHFVLHDWPDEKCREILRELMSAMKPGYSKLILNESILPDTDCSPWFATNDINMMAILAGMTRSRSQYIELVESVGLEVVKVWRSPDPEDAEGVIEAVLKTIKDAVKIVRDLKIRYLWVDALCIIQGRDKEAQADWDFESSQMCQVYEGAFLTLAAASASTAHDGIFRRVPNLNVHHLVLLYKSTSTPEISGPVIIQPGVKRESHNIIEEPLCDRAWTLQEELLSSRALYYTNQELCWKCHSLSTAELTHITPQFVSLQKQVEVHGGTNGVKRTLVSQDWNQTVWQYSYRNLTNGRDKLPALAGLVEKYRREKNDTFLAGHWKNDLCHSLLWTHNPLAHPRPNSRISSTYLSFISPKSLTRPYGRPATYRAPSWSWASVDGEIRRCVTSELEKEKSWTQEATILGCFTISTMPDGLGEISYGEIRLSAYIRRVPPITWTCGRSGRLDYSFLSDPSSGSSDDAPRWIRFTGPQYSIHIDRDIDSEYDMELDSLLNNTIKDGIFLLRLFTGSRPSLKLIERPAVVGYSGLVIRPISKEKYLSMQKKRHDRIDMEQGDTVTAIELTYERVGAFSFLIRPDRSVQDEFWLNGWCKETLALV